MRKQLSHLANASEAPGVHLRVLPMAVGPHRASQSGPFAILDFRAEEGRPAEPTTVYSEGMTGALYLDKPAEVDTYEGIWNALDDLVLDVEQSKELITTIAKEYEHA